MAKAAPSQPFGELNQFESDFVQTAKLALAGGAEGTRSYLRKLAVRYPNTSPALARALIDVLRESPFRSTTTGDTVSKPIDGDSRLSLVREEDPVVLVNEPILPDAVSNALNHVVLEHKSVDRLLTVGLAPTRTVLFVGAPGVGKTLAARWLARELDLPLIVLDLASVMSSFLGRTGVNIKRVLDYARASKAVLLLDELDAVAKRRDDTTEIGELKRLVTVLLQEIDTWPEGSLLVAASNHGELLDPAIWRRFELVLDFPLPNDEALGIALREFLEGQDVPAQIDRRTCAPLPRLFVERSTTRRRSCTPPRRDGRGEHRVLASSGHNRASTALASDREREAGGVGHERERSNPTPVQRTDRSKSRHPSQVLAARRR